MRITHFWGIRFFNFIHSTTAVLGLILLGATPLHAGPVFINEIMYRQPPAVPEDPRGEWIELFNSGATDVDLAGWRFAKGVNFTFTNVTLPAGGYLVVAADRQFFQTNYPSVTNVVGDWSGHLGDRGEQIELVDATGQKADSVTYATEGDWAMRRIGDIYPGQPSWWRGWQWTNAASGGGSSLELVNPAQPHTAGQNWAASRVNGGTPGAVNSVVTNDAAPLILGVRHLPAMPRSTNSVYVSAQILDEVSSNLTVQLYHRLDGTPSFTASPMFDDGQHGDGLAGDGVFGAILPPAADKTIVEFYVQATDGGGHTRTWPGPTDASGTQAANALYQVDNSVYAGSQPIYRFIITAAEANAWANLMDNISGGEYSDAAMNGTVVRVDGVGTDVRYCVDIRNRGAGTRSAHPHNLHLSIPDDDSLGGITSLDFNTRTVQSQAGGNALFSLANLPNAFGAPVQLRFNGANKANATPTGSVDGYQFGSYYCFETYSSTWAANHFPQDSAGNIYKGLWNFDGYSVTNGANLDYRGTNVLNYEMRYTASGPTSATGPYIKENNAPADDWSDLINLIYVLSDNTPTTNYLSAVSQTAHIDEWLRYFAVNSLTVNMETCLGTGDGDDYSILFGVNDPRAWLLNHDLDTVLGQGDTAATPSQSIFKAANLAAISRFLKFPAIAPRYYAALTNLAQTTFAPGQLNAALDQNLASWVPATYIQSMKSMANQRLTNVLAQIPLAVTIDGSVPAAVLTSGIPRYTTPSVTLYGHGNAVATASVRVNGQPAVWSAWNAQWTNTVTLNNGINNVLVQTFDTNDFEIDRTNDIVWYNGASGQSIGGALASNTTLTLAGSPWTVTSSITVPAGLTLTIEPGATLFFPAGAGLTVNGQLLAVGSATNRIQLTRIPGTGATNSWAGLVLQGAGRTNVLSYVDLEWTGSAAQSILASGTILLADHLGFRGTTKTCIELQNSSYIIGDSTFPTLVNAELIHGDNIPANGFAIVQRNVFGSTTLYNDIIDFTGGQRPGPIFQAYDNIFTGGPDDGLDLDGTDAHVENNVFMHLHWGNGHVGDTSSAISGGQNAGQTSHITIARNLFYDCDYGALAKEGNYYTFLNNTFVNLTFAAVNFDEPLRRSEGVTPGRGAWFEGNIVWNTPTNFAGVFVNDPTFGTTSLTVSNNIFQAADFVTNGVAGNLRGDPRLVGTTGVTTNNVRAMLALRPGSPARGAGPNGLDMGGEVPAGAFIAGVPSSPTASTDVLLAVAGPGLVQYSYSLNGGANSAASSLPGIITLTNLPNGTNTIAVLGQNSAGVWQTSPTIRTWVIDTNSSAVVINEVLAKNQTAFPQGGVFPDAFELFNPGALPIDLSGMGLSDDPNQPYKYALPNGTLLTNGQYLVLIADGQTATNFHTVFHLSASGGGLYLCASTNAGGGLIDSITYGVQLVDLSIGRLPGGCWGLTKPTLGEANVCAPAGDFHLVKINEWLAHATAGPDFVELWNGDLLPVNIGGCYVTGSPMAGPGTNPFPPLTFIAANGFLELIADANPAQGANHLDFKLAHEWGAIGLFAPDQSLLDNVLYGPQTADISMGRAPNGGIQIVTFSTPTPGSGNPSLSGTCTVINYTLALLDLTNSVWSFNQTSNLDSVNWIATNYDDSAWPSGLSLLAFENNSLIVPLIHTVLQDPRTPPASLMAGHAYYFRTALVLTQDLSAWTFNATARIDDGAVIYVNGVEVTRIRMPSGTVLNTTLTLNAAQPAGGDATSDELFSIPGSYFKIGQNVIAVEVHQSATTSSDITWGMSMTASLQVTNCATAYPVINEIMAENRSYTNAEGTVTDWVELYNAYSTPIDLADFSLTQDPTQPRLWVFPAGATLPPLSYLIILCDSATALSTTNGVVLNTGFGLGKTGDKLFLYDKLANGGNLVDGVTFNLQASDFGLGRVPNGVGPWVLTLPTPGGVNVAATLGDPSALRVNEWMADPVSGDDWFEIYNPLPQPVSLGGLFLTDTLTDPMQYSIPALSYIGIGQYGAYSEFRADGTPSKGANHVNFKLAKSGESIAIFAADGLTRIDAITFGPQVTGVSQGFFPDGSTNLVNFATTPTPGSANFLPSLDSDGDGMPDDWEIANGTNPNLNDADADPDHDGMSNLQEYLAGTSPTNAASVMRLSATPLPSGLFVLAFNVPSNRTYLLQTLPVLGATNWTDLIIYPPASTNRMVTVTNIAAPDLARFYRLSGHP